MAKFVEIHPQITIDIVITEDRVSLTQREADVALRATNSPPENLVGRRVISGVTFAAYGSLDYLNRMGQLDELENIDLNDQESPFSWIGWDDEGSHIKYFGPSYPKAKVRCRMNSVTTMIEAVKAGIGIAQLPCLIGDPEPTLRRISPVNHEYTFDIWLLVHSDLRHTARFRAFLDFFAEELVSYRK